MAPVVYAFGSNGSGQLAINHRNDVSIPTKCLFHSEHPASDSRPVSIAAGGNHTLLLYSDGSVFAAGQNDDGRCGLPTPTIHDDGVEETSYTTFRRVRFSAASGELLDSFSGISATWSASFFLMRDGSVYAAGIGFKGELGLGLVENLPITNAMQPKQVQLPLPAGQCVSRIVSGVHHTVVVAGNNIYGWGSARHGELGQPLVSYVDSPRRINDIPFQSCEEVLCGLNFTYVLGTDPSEEHSRESNSARHVLLGPGAKHPLSRDTPIAPKLVDCVSVAASWNTIYYIASDGQVTSWGRGERGQLAPTSLTRGDFGGVRKLVAGSEHALALCTDKKIRAWGWGEHGNCGPRHDKLDQTDVAELNVIDISGAKDSTPLGAGCATSWIIADL